MTFLLFLCSPNTYFAGDVRNTNGLIWEVPSKEISLDLWLLNGTYFDDFTLSLDATIEKDIIFKATRNKVTSKEGKMILFLKAQTCSRRSRNI